MTGGERYVAPWRPIITGTVVTCLLVAMAPWMSGGREPLSMMLAGGALLLGALLVWRQPEARVLKSGPLVWAWLAFIGFAGLSWLWSVNRYTTVSWIVMWLMAGLAFCLAYTVSGEKRGRAWLMRGYVVSAAVFGVVAVVMYATDTYDRLTGTFYWANPAAAYLIPAILVCVDWMRTAAGRMIYVWLAAAGLLLTCFWLADSRAAIAVLVLVGAIYLMVTPTPKRFWIRFLFMFVTSILLSITITKLSTMDVQQAPKVVPGSRIAEVAMGESQSLSDRVHYLRSAFEIWFDHPFGGTGAGTYGDVHPQYQHRVVSASSDAHNVYVQVLAELGLPGAALLALVLMWIFVGAVRGFLHKPESFPVLMGVVGLLMHFGLDIDAKYPALLLLAAVLLGAIYRQFNAQRIGAGWRLPAVAGLIMVPLVFLYQSDVLAQRAKADQAEGDYALAAEHFAAAHSGWLYNPDYVGAEGINLYALGAAGGESAGGFLDRALAAARMAQAQDPQDGQHYQLEGRVLVAKKDLKGAEARLREALKRDPYNHPEYALDLAGVQLKAGDREGAVKTAQAMLDQYPLVVIGNRSPDERLRPILANLEALVGNVRLEAGQLDAAEAAAQRALKVYPESTRGRALLYQVELARKPAVAPESAPLR